MFGRIGLLELVVLTALLSLGPAKGLAGIALLGGLGLWVVGM